MDNRPKPKLIKQPEDAEAMARDWMRFFGFVDARLTKRGSDGGVDVQSNGAVAQVKAEMKPIGRPVVQQLNGIAAHESKIGLFFSLSGYTPEAQRWASAAGLALFEFDYSGGISAVNGTARTLLQRADVEVQRPETPAGTQGPSQSDVASRASDLTAHAVALLELQQAKLHTVDDEWDVVQEAKEKIGPILNEIEELLESAEPSTEIEELRASAKEIADTVRTLGVKSIEGPSPNDRTDEEMTAWYLQEFIADKKPLRISASSAGDGGADAEIWRVDFLGRDAPEIVIEILVPPSLVTALGSEWCSHDRSGERRGFYASVPTVGSPKSQAATAIAVLFSGLRSIGYEGETNFTQHYGLPTGRPFSGPHDVPVSVMNPLESDNG